MIHPKTEEELREAMERFRQGIGPAPAVNLDEYEGPLVKIQNAGVVDSETQEIKFHPHFIDPHQREKK